MMYRLLDVAARCIIIVICSCFLLSGCASKHVAEKTPDKFYPEPPALPRIQFLKSFTGSTDIEPAKSAFDTFVTGNMGTYRRLLKPYGVGFYEGKIYVCDTNNTVTVFDLKNKKYALLEGAKGMGRLVQPLNIFITGDGTKYVADPGRGQIIVFDKNDVYSNSYGRPGTWKPVDVAVFEDRVYVVDGKNMEIQVIDKKTGELIRKIGQTDKPTESLARPTNITVDSDGSLYVTDFGRFQIVKYDRDGHFLAEFGGAGQEPGYFARPRGVAVDRDSLIYAVDAAFNNVQLFHKSGQLLMAFGEFGKGKGDLNLPAGIAIDYDNISYFKEYAASNFEIEHLVIVVSQFGDKLVNVYGFGREKGKTYKTFEERRKEVEEELERLKKDEQEKGGQQEKQKTGTMDGK